MSPFQRIQGGLRRTLDASEGRRGSFIVLAFFCLIGSLAFVSMGVDLGVLALTRTRMQNAVDAAALAAAQEITIALEEAAIHVDEEGVGGQVQTATEIAEEAARAMAAEVAGHNGVYVNPDTDVRFGRTTEAGGVQSVQWGVSPYNVVGVTARRDNPSSGQPDSKLELFFAGVFGEDKASIRVDAVSYVESRDIVVVLDYSGSMSYDSQFRGMAYLGSSQVAANMDEIWQTLVNSNVKFSNSATKVKFPSTGFGLINSAVGTFNSSSNSETVFNALGLGATSGGQLLHPFPQEGKNSNGTLKGLPSAANSKTMWKDYIAWCISDPEANTYGYRKKYGYRTLVCYLLEVHRRNHQAEDLWRTPHYPHNALKVGVTLFTEFLEGLEYGDHIGLVTYDTTSRVETGVSGGGFDVLVSLGDDLISNNYDAINAINVQRQATHYDSQTGIGYGIRDARTLLASHGRYGARPTILLMTDGNANEYPSGWSMPGGWSWSSLTDFDGDGDADYSTSDKSKQYTFYQAKLAIDAGVTINTLTVGGEADDDLMRAIAFAGKGIWVDVPGETNFAEFEQQALEAFARIAANVPPAKLMHDPAE